MKPNQMVFYTIRASNLTFMIEATLVPRRSLESQQRAKDFPDPTRQNITP